MIPPKLNVIWILGEAIRNYPGNDQYSKFAVFDKIAPEGIFFNNLVITAPSTIMSQSSMLTGQPPTYLSRTFADFKFDNSYFFSLDNILKANEYNTYIALFHIEGCTLFKGMLSLLEKKHLPSGLKNDTFWSSADVNRVLDHLLEKGLKEPFFLLLNYNNCGQEKTGELIDLAIEKMKKKDIYKNSLFLFCPDHGHFDVGRNGVPTEPHAMILTDANILIPFFIKWPGCPKKTAERPISSLDIVPTILDVLKIPAKKFNFKGSSLLPLVTGKGEYTKTKFRVDTKYIFQEERLVCIRDNKFKYIIHLNNGSEEFFDLVNDPDEKNNVVQLEKYNPNIQTFRDEFKRTEEELVNFHLNYLTQKFEKRLPFFINKNQQSQIKILLLGLVHPLFVKSILEAINNLFSDYQVDVIIESGLVIEGINFKEKVNFYHIGIEIKNYNHIKSYSKQLKNPLFNKYSSKVGINYKNIDYDDFINKQSKLCEKNYDLMIIPLDNPYGAGHRSLLKVAKKVRTKKLICVDYNTNLKKPTNWFWQGLRLIKEKKNYYIQNPKRFLFEVKRYLKEVLN